MVRRRDILAKTGLTTTVLAGCLKNETDEGGNDPDKNEKNEVTYEQCVSPPYVGISRLPAPAEVEILTAILNGEYVTSGDLVLPQAYNIQSTYFTRRNKKDNRKYYIVEAEEEDHLNRLHVKETLPETDPVRLSNGSNDNLTFDIRIKYADIVSLHNDRAKAIIESKGEVLLEETVEIGAGQSTTLKSNKKYRYGIYQAEVEVNELDLEEVITWVMWEEWDSNGRIELSSDGELNHFSGDLTEYGTMKNCEWNEDGELIEGPGVE